MKIKSKLLTVLMITLSLLVIFSNKSINASTINYSSATYASTLGSSRSVKIAVKSVSFARHTYTATVGEIIQPRKITITPSNATNKNVTWSSSNSSVVSISSTGRMIAKSKGKAVITVKTVDGNKKDTCTITVKDKVTVEKIELDTHSILASVGQNIGLINVTFTPSNVVNKTVYWSSSNPSVVSVSSTGRMVAKSKGTAIITAKTENGSKKDTCKVTVRDNIIPVQNIELSPLEFTTTVGQVLEPLEVTITPSNATNKSIKWSSSNPSVMSISSTGKMTALSEGTAMITAQTVDGNKKAICTVNVKDNKVPVKSIEISPLGFTTTVGQVLEPLEVTITPSNATNKKVTWSSSNSRVMSISSTGKMTALSEGTTIITAKTEDGNKIATCSVIVKDENVRVTDVTLNKTSLTLDIGETYQLIETVYPTNATNKNVKWTSSNSNVVTVSSIGKITARGEGTARVVVATNDGGKIDTCVVTVKKEEIPIKEIELSKDELYLEIGETYQLNATVWPSNATNKDLEWTTNNSSIATVSSTGRITARKEGTARIMVSSKDGSAYDICRVIVTDNSISVKEVILDTNEMNLQIGDTYQLTATVYPNNATNKELKWTSSNSSIATVSSTGKIIARKNGTATITVKTVDGNRTDRCIVKVTDKNISVTNVTLNTNKLNLQAGDTYQLTATVYPSNATNKEVKWTSSNSNVAAVSSTGTIVAKSSGTAVITVQTVDGNKTATCTVTIENKNISVTSVTLNTNKLNVQIGDTYQLTAIVNPSNATNKEVKWTSSNSNVATVSPTGTIVAKSSGTAVITVQTVDGNKTATCTVTVKDNDIVATNVSLNKKNLDLKVGNTYQLTATVLPENATNKNVKWYSNNDKVVAIDQNGLLTAKSSGTAIITVTAQNGTLQDTCIINVTDNEAKITISKDWLVLELDEITQLSAIVEPNTEELVWSSTDEKVVSVNEKGVVTANSIGRATIIVSTKDGRSKDTCVVKVIDSKSNSNIQTIKYEITINFIFNINPGTKLEEFKDSISSNTEYQIYDENGNIVKDNEKIGTGMKLKVGSQEYTIIVKGDMNGDGRMSITDFVQIQLCSVNLQKPTEIQEMAMDINGDGKVTITDIVQLKQFSVGLNKLS